ncbi:MAG: hypothetical protein RSD61_02970 [Ruthenibacterium sp.]
MQSAKPTWKENRKLAVLTLVFAVIFAVFGIGSFKVNRIGNKVEAQFAQNIAGDLTARIAAAEGIVAAGEATAGDTAAYKAAVEAVQNIKAAKGAAALYEADVTLGNKIETLYENIHATDGKPEVGSALQTQLSEFRSRGNIISNEKEAYNDTARAAQKKLRGFPAGMLAALTGAKAEPFGA